MEVLESNGLISCSVVAALGSGFAYSLVSQGLQGQPLNAITTAAGFAVFQGIFFKVSNHHVLETLLMNHTHKHLFLILPRLKKKNSVGRKIL